MKTPLRLLALVSALILSAEAASAAEHTVGTGASFKGPLGLQLYSLRADFAKDVPGTLLHTIAELPEAALHRGLAHLQAAELLYETSLFPDLEYTFKHALTHEVAYQSLLRASRQNCHERIALRLEERFPNVVEHQPQLSIRL